MRGAYLPGNRSVAPRGLPVPEPGHGGNPVHSPARMP